MLKINDFCHQNAARNNHINISVKLDWEILAISLTIKTGRVAECVKNIVRSRDGLLASRTADVIGPLANALVDVLVDLDLFAASQCDTLDDVVSYCSGRHTDTLTFSDVTWDVGYPTTMGIEWLCAKFVGRVGQICGVVSNSDKHEIDRVDFEVYRVFLAVVTLAKCVDINLGEAILKKFSEGK